LVLLAASATVAIAVFAGGFGALVGVGGGLIVVPALTAVLDVPLKTAVAASLVGVIATSIVGGARYLESGIADRRLGLVLLVATSVGAIAGGVAAALLDARTLSALFGFVLLTVALQMVRRRPASQGGAIGGAFRSSYIEPRTGETVEYGASRLPLGFAVSLVAGSLSGLLGIGGGVINVPTMNILMGVPVRVAVTTSTYMLGATAAASASVYYARGQLEPLVAAPVALGILFGAQIGSRLAPRVSADVLRLLFAGLSVVFAIQMFGKALT
jgi:hypothetical protein